MEPATSEALSWLTADMLAPLVENVSSAVGVIAPVGLSIMAIMLGITIVPRIIYKFF